MGKAKRRSYTRTAAADDDPRWLLLKAAHQRLAERTLDNELAIIELRKALAAGPPSFDAPISHGRAHAASATIWTERLMLWFGTDGLRVMQRPQPGDPSFPNTVRTFRGWFYVWQPDLDRIWPPRRQRAGRS